MVKLIQTVKPIRKEITDQFAFSGHKMLSPMGIGVLYGKYDILDAMPPFLRGGDMIEYVEEQDTTYAELPAKFEAGTQNVGGAAGLTAAIDYLETITFDRIEAIEKDLVDYFKQRVVKISDGKVVSDGVGGMFN